MKTIQDYIDRYSTVAKNLGYKGDGVDVLIQLLANASYISEVENISYVTEASLEKATLLNSKIQHCVDNMYSVFRGSCPRVVLNIKPTKYIALNPYDLIISSNNFNVYYLGYFTEKPDEDKEETPGQGEETDKGVINEITDTSGNVIDITNGTETTPDEGEDEEGDDSSTTSDISGVWVYNRTFYCDPALTDKDTQVIIGFIAPKRTGENLTIDTTIGETNTYYVDCPVNNLSDDMYIKIGNEIVPRTRIFAEHILNTGGKKRIFDLTLPSFGSRLYLANFYKDAQGRDSRAVEGIDTNTKVFAQYFGYSTLDEYNEPELKRIQLRGAELMPFSEEFLRANCLTQLNTGICYIDATPRDGLNTIHYKANRDRYVSSIIRSNSDIGVVLEECYPEIVRTGGTNYLFVASSAESRNSSVTIFYIPKVDEIYLTSDQIRKFAEDYRAYYIITSTITVTPGEKYYAYFNIDLELFQSLSSDNFDQTIGEDILKVSYGEKFNVKFDESTLKEIESLISKLSNVKKISSLSVTFTDSSGRTADVSSLDPGRIYYIIKYSIRTTVSQTINNI